MTFQEIKQNEEVRALIAKASANLDVLGFTDHSEAHCVMVAERVAYILRKFDYSKEEIELAKIAAFLHDIGNSVNRKHHAEYGAILAFDILGKTDMSLADRVKVMSAIANHDESTGVPVDAMSAALILADKTDVRRNRVRNSDRATFDIHDRVNYAVTKAMLDINLEKKQIILDLEIDESICSMFEYFDIFLGRMQMCRHAAEKFGCSFKLTSNGSRVL